MTILNGIPRPFPTGRMTDDETEAFLCPLCAEKGDEVLLIAHEPNSGLQCPSCGLAWSQGVLGAMSEPEPPTDAELGAAIVALQATWEDHRCGRHRKTRSDIGASARHLWSLLQRC